MNDNDKDKIIEKLKKENKQLKSELQYQKDSHDSGWDFHWDGRGSYEEARRCFYGDFT